MTSSRELRLAVGVVALEFAAAVQTFVASTLLPVIAPALGAQHRLGLLVAGSTVGMFVALPVAGRIVAALGLGRSLTIGLAGQLGGLAMTVTATTAWTFAAGQFVAGLAGGLLAVFGISAVIGTLDDTLRVRVIAASSAMWIVPALVGPAATLAVDHLVGWRLALLLPVPFVVGGRLLVVAAARPERPRRRPLGRTLLVPLGAALVVAAPAWPLTVLGSVLAGIGVVALLPVGTLRLERGAPAGLMTMLLFATGYFGADRFITVLLTGAYGVSLAAAAVVLSAAPLAWAVTSLVAQRVARRPGAILVGLALAALGTGAVAVTSVFAVALVAWTCTGVGVGLAYPGMYLRCTVAEGESATDLATAVITAEAFGSLVGPALGGVLLVDAGATTTYLVFAVVLALGAAIALRSTASRPTVAAGHSVRSGR